MYGGGCTSQMRELFSSDRYIDDLVVVFDEDIDVFERYRAHHGTNLSNYVTHRRPSPLCLLRISLISQSLCSRQTLPQEKFEL